MDKSDLREAVKRFWPLDRGEISKKEALRLVENVLAEAGVLTAGDGRKVRAGVVDVHRRALCLMSSDGDGFHLQPLREGQEIDVLISPANGWQRCRVVAADGDALTRTVIATEDDNAPVIGAPARVPLVLDSGYAARTFASISTGADGTKKEALPPVNGQD